MSSKFVSALITGSICLLAGCDARKPAPSGDWLAKVGVTSIPVSEVQTQMDRHTTRGLRSSPQKVLDELILREALVARALELGLDREPEFLRSYKSLLISELKKRELEPWIRAAEIDNTQPSADISEQKVSQIRLAILRQQIHAKTSEKKIREVQTRLEEARAKAAELPESESGFGSLAIDYSDDQATRYRGGDLGWVIENGGKLLCDPAMLSAGFKLKEAGEISPVIRGKDGLYVVRLLGRRVVESSSREQAEAVARHRLHLGKRQQIEQAFEQDVRAGVPIVVNEEKLAQLKGFAESTVLTE